MQENIRLAIYFGTTNFMYLSFATNDQKCLSTYEMCQKQSLEYGEEWKNWLLVVFGLNGPLRQYSIYIGPSHTEREKE